MPSIWASLKICHSVKSSDSAEVNLKFDENVRQFFKRVENTVDKGEIVYYQQFLLFVQCFKLTCTAVT